MKEASAMRQAAHTKQGGPSRIDRVQRFKTPRLFLLLKIKQRIVPICRQLALWIRRIGRRGRPSRCNGVPTKSAGW